MAKMGTSMRRLWRAMGALVVQGPEDSEDRLRLRFYSVFVALAIPVMIGFGIAAFLDGNRVLAGLILASWVGLITGWLRLRAGHDDRVVYRANALIFGLLVFYMIVVGGEGGSKSLWVYVYPLIMVFLFGVFEGSIWTGALLVIVVGLLWLRVPGLTVYAYPEAFKIRLVSMYSILAIVTMGFEHSRRRYRDAMWREREKLERETQLLSQEVREREKAEREKEVLIQELQDTLAQVKTLKGLVPICARCHRIRDDQGFWNQLEMYLREHSDDQFSHGICPACVKAHYSEFYSGGPEPNSGPRSPN